MILLSIIVSSFIAAGLLGYKLYKTHDWGIIAAVVARVFLGGVALISLIDPTAFNYSYTPILLGILLILVSSIINSITYFLQRKYIHNFTHETLQNALSALQHKYETLTETSLVGIYVLSAEGKINYANKRACEIVGYSQEEVLGRSIYELIPLEEQHIVKENIRKRITNEVITMDYVVHLIAKDNQLKLVRVMGSRTVNGHVTITGTVIEV